MRELRPELVVLGGCLLCWLAALGLAIAGRPAAGSLDVALYPLYGTAAGLGWLAGNVYVARGRAAAPRVRRLLRTVYLLGPPGAFFLAWSLAPRARQEAIPLAPVYAYAIYALFFFVPVTLRRR